MLYSYFKCYLIQELWRGGCGIQVVYLELFRSWWPLWFLLWAYIFLKLLENWENWQVCTTLEISWSTALALWWIKNVKPNIFQICIFEMRDAGTHKFEIQLKNHISICYTICTSLQSRYQNVYTSPPITRKIQNRFAYSSITWRWHPYFDLFGLSAQKPHQLLLYNLYEFGVWCHCNFLHKNTFYGIIILFCIEPNDDETVVIFNFIPFE